MQQPPSHYPYQTPPWGYPPPQPVYMAPAPRRTPWGVIIAVVSMLLIIAVVLWFVLIPFAGNVINPSSWVYGDNDNAVYLTWTADGSSLTGSLNETFFNGTSIQAATAGFTGTRNGNQIAIAFSVLGTTTTYSGTLGFRSLTMNFPNNSTGQLVSYTFQPGDATDYNNAVFNVQQHHLSGPSSFQASPQEDWRQGSTPRILGLVREAGGKD